MIQSVGNSTTTPRDHVTPDDVRLIIPVLADSVAVRLRSYGLKCGTVQISIRDNQMLTIEPGPSAALACDLVTADGLVQLSLLDDLMYDQRQKDLEVTIDQIRHRYGYFSVQRGLMLSDRRLSGFNPREEHVIHPVAFSGL